MRQIVINLLENEECEIPPNAFYDIGVDVSYGIASGAFVYDDCTKWTFTDDTGNTSVPFTQDFTNKPLGPLTVKAGGTNPIVTCTKGGLTVMLYGVNPIS